MLTNFRGGGRTPRTPPLNPPLIKFVSDLRQVGGFLQGTPVSSTNKTYSHARTEILLKVALNTINQTHPRMEPHISWPHQTFFLIIIFK
jgi:hypothetical protein